MNGTSPNATLSLIQNQIDRLGDCNTDAPMVFVNGFSRICAKVQSRKHGTIAAWGNDIDEALTNLAVALIKV
jgi:hypothetical protein